MTTEKDTEINHNDALEIGIANLQKLHSELKKSALAEYLMRTRIVAIQYTINFLKEHINKEKT
jgi:hypothetical protein